MEVEPENEEEKEKVERPEVVSKGLKQAPKDISEITHEFKPLSKLHPLFFFFFSFFCVTCSLCSNEKRRFFLLTRDPSPRRLATNETRLASTHG